MMTKVYRTRQGEEARQAYRRVLAERDASEGPLPPATIVDAIKDRPDGLLLKETLNAPIRVIIPEFDMNPPIFDLPTRFWLQWRRDTETEFHDVSEVEELPHDGSVVFPLSRQIDLARFEGQEGQFVFRHSIITPIGNANSSVPVPIRLDRTAPYGQFTDPNDNPPKIVLTSKPIKDDTLTAEKGVECTIPDFVDPDKAEIFVAIGWGEVPPDPGETIVPAFAGLLPSNRKVTIPREKVEKFNSGTHYVTYVLRDPAGNVSKFSWVESVSVALGDLPTKLQLHSVPLHDDGLINRADAAAPGGVRVEIPLYENHQPGDQIFVEWGDSLLQPVPVDEPPAIISIPVNWTRLKAAYNFTTGGVQVVKVGYRVERAPQVDFRPTPPTIDINVDFSMTGPIDPEDPNPDPVNPLLGLVTVRGDSDLENELPEADFGKPATAKFEAPDPIVDGDTFTLYWNGVKVDDTYVSDGTEDPGDEITIDITWDEILEGGAHSQLPVYYVMSNAKFPNNDQESDVTHVQVDAIRVIPDAPVFTDIGTEPGLNCKVLCRVNGVVGYRVTVPPSDYLEPGENIELRWRVYQLDGTTPIPAVSKTTSLTIPDNAQTAGIQWFIEYDQHILPVDAVALDRYAKAVIDYTTPVNDEPKPSAKTEKTMSLSIGSPGATCRLEEVGPC